MPENPGERRAAHRERRDGTGATPIVVVTVLAIIAVVLIAGVVNIIRLSAGNPEDLGPAAQEESGVSDDELPEGGEQQDSGEENEAPVEKTAEVTVLNGSGVSGVAATYSDLLGQNDWNVVETGNYSTPDSTSTVYYSAEEFRAQAELLAEETGAPDVEQSAEFSGDVTLVVCSDLASTQPGETGTDAPGTGTAPGGGTGADEPESGLGSP
ncbi:LytR C-terminal domain-containing protein [Sediminivirga luteola]|uniref:LytR/CpsA/Psr regulator C-terminal domain-containing protein n=1 Tax=Sediminivirga luteola TaxID=1774748 RepID=A0A8J2TVE4_9MICO|nr:LytR C-terminal domain-containing protein [Sediminivirga luteola]GGA03451.1 hypothetical protein GCM10011333_02720 [Sediminivirga luteola]